MNTARQYTPLDQFIMEFDTLLKAKYIYKTNKIRPSPADSFETVSLKEQIKSKSGCLMRVNHAGEVSAQALYQGQAVTAKSPHIREVIINSAREEIDHLFWCRQRLKELETHPSYLNPLWYAGSFTLGVFAGYMGDKWSLGFIAETESQVMYHLESHLVLMPKEDIQSKAIIEQMKEDEEKHASLAIELGARELPRYIKNLMKLSSKVMTKTAYWI